MSISVPSPVAPTEMQRNHTLLKDILSEYGGSFAIKKTKFNFSSVGRKKPYLHYDLQFIHGDESVRSTVLSKLRYKFHDRGYAVQLLSAAKKLAGFKLVDLKTI